MPQAIPLIAGYVGSGLVAATGAYAAVAAIAGGIVAYGTTKLLGLDEMPALPEPGVQANVKGTVQPIPIVYGRRRVGGVLAQVCTTGKVRTQIVVPGSSHDIPDESDNRYLNMVLCWCEGEIEGVNNLYLDDRIDTRSEFTGVLGIHHHTGTDDQVADASFLTALDNTFTPEGAAKFWSTNHRLRGIAYTYCKLEYNAKAYPTGLPTITADLNGRKVLDVRTSTWAWSDNPALCIYDYLTNTRFGRGIDASEIDTQSFIDAANYCEQIITIQAVPVEGAPYNVTQARYGCDAILNPDSTCLDNLRVLLGTCRGVLVFSGGLYKLKLDKPEVSSFALTADNIVGAWSILLESGDTRYNRVQAQWVNKAIRYQEDYALLESAAYLAADNNQVLEARIDLPATTNYLRPRQMAGMVLRQSRYSLQCEVTCTIEGLTCEVYDVISVTHETPGWDGQLFRVMGISLESDDQVRLQLQQYADEVYDLDSQNEEDSPPPTNLPNPLTTVPILSFTSSTFEEERGDGTVHTSFILEWVTKVDSTNHAGFAVRWRVVGAEGWTTVELKDLSAWPLEVLGVMYYVYNYEVAAPRLVNYEAEVRALNKLGIQSDPEYLNMGSIGGSSVPTAPSGLHLSGDAQGIRLRWTKGALAVRTEIRGSLSANDFANSEFLASVTGAGYLDVRPVATLMAYWVRSVSASGVPSAWTPPSSGAGSPYYAGLSYYADDAAAAAGGLTTGDLYKDGSHKVVVKV